MNGTGEAITREELELATGDGVRVLVADTGVDGDHPMLCDADLKHWKVEKEADGDADLKHWKVEKEADGEMRITASAGGDLQGHGTAVASIVRSHAPGVQIHSLQVIQGGLSGQSSTVIAGLSWAVDAEYDLVNCSFGTRQPAFLKYYKRLVDRAFCRNVLMIAAGSNQDYRIVEYPSAFPTVLSTDCGKLDPERILRRTGHLVEFVACGDGVRVPWGNGEYRTVSGSSFASAHLTALIARVRQLRPRWNACQVKAALYGLAEPDQ
jgi:subtilisin family serine protease